MKTLKYLLVFAAALLLQTGAWADDTDVFASTKPNKPANILLIFDNGASFSSSTGTDYCNISSAGVINVGASTTDVTNLGNTAGGIEQCAMYAALSSVAVNDNVKIGMMMFNAGSIYNGSTGAFAATGCNGTTGGCLVLPMNTWNTTAKTNTLDWIRKWTGSGSSNYVVKGPSSTSNGGIMQEAYAMFQGKTGISGVSYSGVSAGCGGNYIIYIGNAYNTNTAPGDQTGTKGPYWPLTQDARISSTTWTNPAITPAERDYLTTIGTVSAGPYKITLGANPTSISCSKGSTTSQNFASANENSGAFGINWAKYLSDNFGVPTTPIALLSSTCNPLYSTFLDALGTAGGRDFVATNDYAGLKAAVGGAVSSIIASNSVFASVSLPVSVNLQSEYLNQVFIGMFRPDAQFHARWLGNLKQYQLAFTDSTKTNIKLVDADGTSAINVNTGFVTECARSFWTPSTVNTYWALDKKGNCATVSTSTATATALQGSDFPDGNVVEKGAQAYVLRTATPSSRTVKTCGTTMATCTNSLSDFTTSLAPTLFGASVDSTTRDNYVNWARGQNVINGDESAAPVASTAMRPSAHGDVVHSRPVAVDYGGSTGVVVYYGANDGMLRAVNGNQTTTFTVSGTSYAAGQELWAFMPPEFYGNIGTLYSNAAFVYYKGTPDSPAISKLYGMDGPLTSLSSKFGGGSTKNYIFATMRRGGRAIYAFDVTTPTSPNLVWKSGCSSALMSSTDCSTGYSNMGQTWASAKSITTTQYTYANGTSKPLLIVGGGYDTCEDTDSGTANNSCSSSKGSQVYIIDASDGTVVRSFATATPYSAGTGNAPRGVIGEPTVINVSGNAKYAYIADLGGVVYRISFTGSLTSDWTMTPIAKVGCDVPSTGCSENRKFMFQPSVVSADGVTFYILLGSGDREKPTTQYTAATAVTNYFFAIKDQPASSTYLTDACGSGNNYVCLSSLMLITASNPDSATLATKKGWYLQVSSTEQVVTSAITQYGLTTFSTHTPFVSDPNNACASSGLGKTKVYSINYADASPASGTDRYAYVSGDGGLPPSPVAGTVVIDGTAVPFCIGCSADSPLQAKEAKQSSAVSRAKGRLYWFIQKN
jgi:type IV pilus assembly protein PilY1